jgi:hypothetical protein
MDKLIENVIEEAFKSKAQQRYFYYKAGKGSKKWQKMAKEFSDKTDFDKLPEKVKKTDIDEIVDEDGNYISGGQPTDVATKQITSKSTTDKVVKTAFGQMGHMGVAGGIGVNKTLKYWAESDMSKALGYEDTMGEDLTYDDAKIYFKKTLGLSDEETQERLTKMGYDEQLPEEKLRLIENAKNYIEEYVDELLKNRSKNKGDEIVKKNEEEIDNRSINPIIKKQFQALIKTIKKNGLDSQVVIKHLCDNE